MKIFGAICIALITLVSCSPTSGIPDTETLTDLGLRPIPNTPEVPDISFTDSDGKTLQLSDFRGEVVLLNFWATWCPPCRAEMPAMGRLAEALGSREFAMVPVNVGESKSLVENFAEEYDVDFDLYFDEPTEAAQIMGVTALPTSILVDRKGRGVAIVAGALEWDSPEIIKVLDNWAR